MSGGDAQQLDTRGVQELARLVMEIPSHRPPDPLTTEDASSSEDSSAEVRRRLKGKGRMQPADEDALAQAEQDQGTSGSSNEGESISSPT